MKYAEIQKMSDEQLTQTLATLRKELFDLRSTAVTEQVTQTHQFGALRRDIARFATELTGRNPKPARQAKTQPAVA